jgi:hypothetical protein
MIISRSLAVLDRVDEALRNDETIPCELATSFLALFSDDVQVIFMRESLELVSSLTEETLCPQSIVSAPTT